MTKLPHVSLAVSEQFAQQKMIWLNEMYNFCVIGYLKWFFVLYNLFIFDRENWASNVSPLMVVHFVLRVVSLAIVATKFVDSL